MIIVEYLNGFERAVGLASKSSDGIDAARINVFTVGRANNGLGDIGLMNE